MNSRMNNKKSKTWHVAVPLFDYCSIRYVLKLRLKGRKGFLLCAPDDVCSPDAIIPNSTHPVENGIEESKTYCIVNARGLIITA